MAGTRSSAVRAHRHLDEALTQSFETSGVSRINALVIEYRARIFYVIFPHTTPMCQNARQIVLQHGTYDHSSWQAASFKLKAFKAARTTITADEAPRGYALIRRVRLAMDTHCGPRPSRHSPPG